MANDAIKITWSTLLDSQERTLGTGQWIKAARLIVAIQQSMNLTLESVSGFKLTEFVAYCADLKPIPVTW